MSAKSLKSIRQKSDSIPLLRCFAKHRLLLTFSLPTILFLLSLGRERTFGRRPRAPLQQSPGQASFPEVAVASSMSTPVWLEQVEEEEEEEEREEEIETLVSHCVRALGLVSFWSVHTRARVCVCAP